LRTGRQTEMRGFFFIRDTGRFVLQQWEFDQSCRPSSHNRLGSSRLPVVRGYTATKRLACIDSRNGTRHRFLPPPYPSGRPVRPDRRSVSRASRFVQAGPCRANRQFRTPRWVPHSSSLPRRYWVSCRQAMGTRKYQARCKTGSSVVHYQNFPSGSIRCPEPRVRSRRRLTNPITSIAKQYRPC
jgi:hypothetical protein